MLKAKKFPEQLSELKIDPEESHSCLFAGLYEESVEVNGKNRLFYTYLKKDLHYARPCVFIVPDDGQDTLEYLENSFWMDFADKAEVFLFILTPDNGTWDFCGKDADYMNRIYMQVQSRNYYVTIQDTMYAVGIGRGAVIAQQAAMSMTSEWAGLATFGDMTEEALINSENTVQGLDTGRAEMAISGEKAQLPVWMVWGANTEINRKVADYWKKQNHVDLEAFSNVYADEVYFPAKIWKKSQLNDQLISEVHIKNNFNGEVTEEIWMPVWNYLKGVFRYRSRGKMLRRRKEVKDYGLELHKIVHDGFTRIWYEYVPENVKKLDAEVPLVIALHARGSSAEFYVSLSDMTTIAEERGFIVAFPESGFYQQKEGGLPNIPLWNGSYQGKGFDDTGFILGVVQDIKFRHKIDAGRVYATGQSSGGMMTSALGLKASSEFAAVACSSALIDPEHEIPLPKEINPAIPYMFLFGENDWLVAGKDGGKLDFKCNEEIAKFVENLMEIYELNTKPMEYVSGEIHFYIYCNQQKIPMFTVGRVAGMSHAIYPRESWLMYDEFLCKYSRREDGTLLYMGEEVRV